MFFAAGQDGSFTPLEMSGVGGSAAVKDLQAALGKLATTVRRPAAHPGPTTGVIGERTMVSIAGMMDILQRKLPSWAASPLIDAISYGASSTEAKNTVGRYVTELKIAVMNATNEFGRLPELPSMPSFQLGLTDSFFTAGWYTSVPRLAVIGGILLLGYWLFAHER